MANMKDILENQIRMALALSYGINPNDIELHLIGAYPTEEAPTGSTNKQCNCKVDVPVSGEGVQAHCEDIAKTIVDTMRKTLGETNFETINEGVTRAESLAKAKHHPAVKAMDAVARFYGYTVETAYLQEYESNEGVFYPTIHIKPLQPTDVTPSVIYNSGEFVVDVTGIYSGFHSIRHDLCLHVAEEMTNAGTLCKALNEMGINNLPKIRINGTIE